MFAAGFPEQIVYFYQQIGPPVPLLMPMYHVQKPDSVCTCSAREEEREKKRNRSDTSTQFIMSLSLGFQASLDPERYGPQLLIR